MGDKFDEMAKSLAISIVEMARVRSALTCELEHDEADCVTEATNDIAQAIRMAVEEERESKWQPIETAPKNGTRIWAWFPFELDAYAIRWAKNDYEDSENWTLDGGESATLSYDPPTHWSPIPAIRSRSQS